MDRIDERSRRTPGFTEGVPAELADGQAWTFPRIRIRLAPRPGADGRYTVALGKTAGPDLPRYADWLKVLTSPTPVPGDVWWDASFDAATALLKANYELSDDELAALLVWEEGDDAAERRWDRIRDAVQGIGAPKASSAT